MNGRNIFEKYRLLIFIIKKLTYFIPTPLFKFLYNITKLSESKLSVFFRYLFIFKYSRECGENIYIGSHVILKNIHNLRIGSNVSIHSFNYIDAAGGLSIDDNVSIATSTSIITFEHTWEDKSTPIKYNDIEFKKVNIKKDVWIGANVTILGGVNVHERAVVAAGAVVNKDVKSGTLVGGVPIKHIKTIC